MDDMQWLRESWLDTLAHLEDSLRNGDFDMIEHVTEDCQCVGKWCSRHKHILCFGLFSRNKNGKHGLAHWCKQCTKENNCTRKIRYGEQIKADKRRWRLEHPELVREHRKRYNQNHAQELREKERLRSRMNRGRYKVESRGYARKFRHAHLEKCRERNRRWYWNSAELNRVKQRIYKQMHTTAIKEQSRQWRQNNSERAKANYHKRRTRKSEAGGSYTAAEWQALKATYNYTCLCCGKQEPEIKLTADHVIPVSKLGTSNIDNIQPLCLPCNIRKHNKILDYR